MSGEIRDIEPWSPVHTKVSYDGTTDWMSPFVISWRNLDSGKTETASIPFGLFVELAKIYSPMYGEPHYESPETLCKIYTSPPKDRIDADVATAQARLDDINKRISEASCELRDLERETPKRIEVLRQRSAALARIEEFLDDKITHFVVHDYGPPSIKTAEEMGKTDSQYDCVGRGARKMLTLWGRPDRGMEWRINEFSDGSGSWTTVIPCLSEDDAKLELASIIATADAKNLSIAGDMMAAADAHGLPFPDDLREAIVDSRVAAARINVERPTKLLNEAQRELTEAIATK